MHFGAMTTTRMKTKSWHFNTGIVEKNFKGKHHDHTKVIFVTISTPHKEKPISVTIMLVSLLT